MKVLVTGATGFLGQDLVSHLLEKKYCVTAIGRDDHKGQKLTELGAHFIHTDIFKTPLNELIQLWGKYDALVHCAALSSTWGPFRHFYDQNVVVTQKMLQFAELTGIKTFIHISSPSIYTQEKNITQLSEDHLWPSKKINHYASTKAMADQAVQSFNSSTLAKIILRPMAIMGRGDEAILPRLIKMGMSGIIPITKKMPVFIDLTHVRNVSHSIELSLQYAQKHQKPLSIFNISNGTPIDFKAMIDWLYQELNLDVKKLYLPYQWLKPIALLLEKSAQLSGYRWEPKLTKFALCLLTFDRTLDISSAKTMLGYQPIISHEETLQESLQWAKLLMQRFQAR